MADDRRWDIKLEKGRRIAPAFTGGTGAAPPGWRRSAGIGPVSLEYETRDLPAKEKFRKEIIGKEVKRHQTRKAKEYTAMRKKFLLRPVGWPPVPKSAARRIEGVKAAQKYLAKAAPTVGKLRKAVRAVRGMGAMVAAEEGLKKIGVPLSTSEAASYGLMASRAAMPAAVATGVLADVVSRELGKRHGEAAAHEQRTRESAREYTQAKDWKAIRKAAFRRGIAKPGGKAMTLEEAYEIAKKYRNK